MPLHHCHVRLGLIVVCLGGLRGPAALEAAEAVAAAPWQRKLTGADARRAAELERQIAVLRQAGQEVEAQRPARALLELRTRGQGADHWQTTDVRQLLRNLEKVAALPEEARAELVEVNKLGGRVAQLYRRGRYGEAVPLLRRVLEVRRRHLGTQDSQTISAVNNLAFFLDQSGKHTEAEPLYRQALEARRKALGEDHPDIALSYNNLAINLLTLGKSVEAEGLSRRALAINQRVLGEEHPDTAETYNALGMNLRSQGKYAAADPLLRKALAIKRKLLGDDHLETASSYNNVATILHDQGQYAAAAPLLRQALAVRRKVLGEDHPDTADGYNNVAANLQAQGRYADAEPLFRQALAVRRKVLGDDHPVTANSYNNVAYNLTAQGKYVEAEPLYRRALAIYRQALGEEHREMAATYSNLALNLKAQRRHAEAEALFRQALAIFRKTLGDEHPETAVSYHNVALSLMNQEQYADADVLFRKAIAIYQKTLGEDHPHTATSYFNLALNMGAQGKYDEAEPLLRQTLAIRRRVLGEAHPDTALSYDELATNQYAQGRYRAAERWGRAAAASFETARRAVSFGGLERTAFTAAQTPLFRLTAFLAHNGKAEDAWNAWEANCARGLLDDLAARLARPLTEPERRREHELSGRLQALDKQAAALLRSPDRGETRRQQLEQLHQQRDEVLLEVKQFEAELAQRYGPAAGEVYDLARVQAQLPADAALVCWVDVQGDPRAADPNGAHWACLVRRRGQPVWVALPGSGPAGAWNREDDRLPGRVRQLLVRPPADSTATWRELTGQLYTQRLAPLSRHLGPTADLPAVRQLIVLPSPALAGVPVEALVEARTDRQPAYLVSSAPSGTMFAWLQKKKQEARAHGSPPGRRLLALGDPVFAKAGESGSVVPPLPGSRGEVEAIARLFDQADTLLGSRASEQQLDELAGSGRLREYGYLHLATHGVLDPQFALQSALLLARDHLPDPLQQVAGGKRAYDGRLTAEQILRTWKLDADLVTLSACQSGLGKHQGGEGYLGFAQALLLAGGRSLVLSLWQVDDSATALLMSRFYQNLLGKRPGLEKPLPKAEALAEAKAWLRGLTAREVDQRLAELPRGAERERPAAPAPAAEHPYAHPYYWAAFILIGDPR
jgi:CHAT domain-containing protein/tetratricopeptide (TPR) repeat protein